MTSYDWLKRRKALRMLNISPMSYEPFFYSSRICRPLPCAPVAGWEGGHNWPGRPTPAIFVEPAYPNECQTLLDLYSSPPSSSNASSPLPGQFGDPQGEELANYFQPSWPFGRPHQSYSKQDTYQSSIGGADATSYEDQTNSNVVVTEFANGLIHHFSHPSSHRSAVSGFENNQDYQVHGQGNRGSFEVTHSAPAAVLEKASEIPIRCALDRLVEDFKLYPDTLSQIVFQLRRRTLQEIREELSSFNDPIFQSLLKTSIKLKVGSDRGKKASLMRQKNLTRFGCRICGDGFTTRHNTQNHIKAHFPCCRWEKCCYCESYFVTFSVLKRHQKTCKNRPDTPQQQCFSTC
ncbi:hypothetical protein B0H34DRAFT_162442 [Crassisporium funariophilum]|nr:hypothetical protein B0H34DRAFT_162442 [Crassisporium funariophilum]